MNRRHASILLLLGLLFAEGFAIAPARPGNDLRVAITVVCADPAAEFSEARPTPPAFPARPASTYQSPAPLHAPSFALFQRPPPAA